MMLETMSKLSKHIKPMPKAMSNERAIKSIKSVVDDMKCIALNRFSFFLSLPCLVHAFSVFFVFFFHFNYFNSFEDFKLQSKSLFYFVPLLLFHHVFYFIFILAFSSIQLQTVFVFRSFAFCDFESD